MEFEFTQGEPISEEEALAEAEKLGLHAFTLDTETSTNTDLHCCLLYTSDAADE